MVRDHRPSSSHKQLWWREAWSIRFDVGYFRGISLGLWLRVLHENHFAIDSPYWGRAGAGEVRFRLHSRGQSRTLTLRPLPASTLA